MKKRTNTINYRLNEDNISQVEMLDAELGAYDYKTIDNTISLNINENPNVHLPVSGGIMCVELGYSIDFQDVSKLLFQVNNQVCMVKTVGLPSELKGKILDTNEVYLVTEHPFFKTVVWMSRDNQGEGKLLHYRITTFNSTISTNDFNYIAKKLNALDLKYINDNFTTLDGRITENRELIQKNVVSIEGLTRKTNGIERMKTNAEGEDEKFETKITDDLSAGNIYISQKLSVSNINTRDINASGEINAEGGIGTKTNIIAEGFAIAKELSATDKVSTKDFEITGNVNGVLKDKDGFTYLKVIKGVPKTLQAGYSDVEVLVYPNGDCVVTGCLTETTNQNVDAGALSVAVPKGYPCLLNTIKYINLNDITQSGARFLLSLSTFTTNIINILYRNILSSTQDIITTKLYFTLKGTKTDLSDINII